MKWITVLTVAALSFGTGMAGLAESSKSTAKSAKSTEGARKAKKGGKLRHVVAFKFKDGTSKDDIKKVEDAFRALKSKIPQIAKFEAGTNNSPEGLNKGCSHAWVLTFNSEKDRDDYLVHPDHKAFGKLLGPFLADVFVLDFWAKE